jgi:hypothetical protein
MKFSPLTEEERAATQFTHRLDFSYRDITASIANNTAKTWGAGYLPAVSGSDIVRSSELHLTVPFQDVSDSAFNSTTLSFGDTTTATRFINASETNLNGTEVIDVIPGAVTNAIYTAAGQLQLTLNAMANKSISDIDKGQGYILVQIQHADDPAFERVPPFSSAGSVSFTP